MNKRIVAVLLILLLCAMTACGETPTPADDQSAAAVEPVVDPTVEHAKNVVDIAHSADAEIDRVMDALTNSTGLDVTRDACSEAVANVDAVIDRIESAATGDDEDLISAATNYCDNLLLFFNSLKDYCETGSQQDLESATMWKGFISTCGEELNDAAAAYLKAAGAN